MSTSVYLSNIPSFCQEQDVYRALLAYGSATEVQINRQNNSAAVTMRTPQEAQALRNQHTVNIMGSIVNVNAMAPMPPMPQSPPQQSYGSYPGAGGSVQQQSSMMGGLRLRLRFVVENCTYPVTRQLLLQLFNMVAQPTHLFCGPPAPTTCGDVEFQDQATTDRVMQELNNKFIYPDCCLMHLYYDQPQPSHMSPAQPMGMSMSPPQPSQQQQPMAHQHIPPAPMNQSPYGNYEQSYGGSSMPSPPPPMAPQPHPQQMQQPQQNPMGIGMGYGNQPPYMYDGQHNTNNHINAMPNNTNNGNPSQMNMPSYDGSGMDVHANGPSMMMSGPGPAFRGGRGGGTVDRGGAGMMMMRGGRGGAMSGGRGDGMMFDPMGGQGYRQGNGNFPVGGRGGGPAAMAPPVQQDGTVMISNVSEAVPLYDLWVLLEVYGNVNSLKRMFKEKMSVVAQFQHAVDARNAVFNLHGCRFRGHTLSLKHFAGYVERGRVEWNAGPATDPSTQAVLFTSGYHHRTKPNAPFNVQGRVHPEKYLYISNLTRDISDATVKELLSSAKDGQPRREVIKLFRKNDMSAIAEFKDVETSVDALIVSHAHQIKDRYLRVTFSRHPTEPRVATEKSGSNEEPAGEEPSHTDATPEDASAKTGVDASATVADAKTAETA